jgi:hypothetical protein
MRSLLPLLLLVAVSAHRDLHSVADLDGSWFSENILMQSLKDAWQGAQSDVGYGTPRITIASLLERLDARLRNFWDAVPKALQEEAQARAKVPLQSPQHSPLPGPYWRWIPEYMGDVPPSVPLSFSSPCFASTSALGAFDVSGNFDVTVSVSDPTSGHCKDSYLLASGEWLSLVTFSATAGARQNRTVKLPVTMRAGT